LRIDLPAQSQLSGVAQFRRHADLLLTGNRADLHLFSLRDGSKPQLLAKWESVAELLDIALSEGYAAVLDKNAQIQLYDLSNLYAPRQLASPPNNRKIGYESIRLAGDLLLARAGQRLFHGQIQGAELSEWVLETPEDLVA